MEVENQQQKHILCIQYLVSFKKGHTKVQALINFDSKVNAIIPAYAAVLGLRICLTDVRA